ncbi:TraB/GumN family protein [Oceanobacter mangrovi]|uniref:TraB/GumN family protein n=1 Tax=Oceanobacter mangrovi TaxID=2862510 RepID=UPI001C8CF7FD|nr:TraB/GumN family protein [Oceanobacter mangrovi]
MKTLLKTPLFALLQILLFATTTLLGSHSQADASVWQVSKNGSHIYLAGTIHLLKPSDYPLPDEYETAFQHSDRLVFETDIGKLNTPELQQLVAQTMLAGPEETIDKVLSPRTYSALMLEFGKRGMSLQQLRPFKVSLAILTLTVAEMKARGLTASGVDEYFYQRALEQGKALGMLESVQQQIDFLANMGKGSEDEMVSQTLRDLQEIETKLADMVAAWRNGNTERMNQELVEDMRINYPQVYQQLLVTRNNNWLPGIERLFAEDGTELVMVGAAHLVGPDGLLARLQQAGYEISRP